MGFPLGFATGIAVALFADMPGVRVGERVRNGAAGFGLRRDDETPIAGWRAALTRIGGMTDHEIAGLVEYIRQAGPGLGPAISDTIKAAELRAKEGKAPAPDQLRTELGGIVKRQLPPR